MMDYSIEEAIGILKQNSPEIGCDYDEENNSLFIYSKKDYMYDKSVEHDNNLIIDYDKNNHIVAFEFLNTSLQNNMKLRK